MSNQTRMYYNINESGAKRAKEISSFYDYVPNSRTEEYIKKVDVAYDLAELVASKKPEESENAWKLADRYSKRLSDNINQDINISLRCPSVMITGSGSFPVRKKEKQVAAWSKNFKELEQIESILQSIKSLLYKSAIIKSDDANAVDKLQKKLDNLVSSQEKMKQINAYYKKYKNIDDCDLIDTEEISKAVMENMKYCGKPFPSFVLTNNLSAITSTKQRLECILRAKNKETIEILPVQNKSDLGSLNALQYNIHIPFKSVINREIMRVQIIFDEKPNESIRDLLKSNGFKWSPTQNAWQRQLTANGEYSIKKVCEILMAKIENNEDLF